MKKINVAFFLWLFLSCAAKTYSAQEPPPPMEVRSPCGAGDGGTTAPPPPVGLCLPINDYLLPMLLTGICYGAFRMNRIQEI